MSTRRRFLQISAAALAVPAGSARASGTPLARWRGMALGAGAQMTLAGVSEAEAAPVFAGIEAEVARLERIFSLYRDDSDLVELNRSGHLPAPQPEMLEVLSLSQNIWRASGGRFNPAVQPLWRAIAEQQPDADVERARALANWPGVTWSPAEVRFARPGMALTLNGIAQGYITDRVAALLRARGFGDVLIDMGELRALGQHPQGRPWRAGVADASGQIVRHVQLSERALATSSPLATRLGKAQQNGHILPPGHGDAVQVATASVSAPGAAIADGLSTAATLMTRSNAETMLAAFSGARLELHS